MKRLTAPWTTALATAALITLPVAGSAQTPQTQPEPQPQQSTTLSTPSAQDQTSAQSESPAEHLRQAKAALENVDANNVPARAKTKLAELKRHINSLERSAAVNDSASTTGTGARSPQATASARGKANWANDVAAIDRIITELAGSGAAGMTGSTESATTGTSGAEPKAKAGKSETAALDETSRSKLMEVRSHITAFAAAMSGTAAPSAPSNSTTSGASAGTANSASAHGSAATGHAGAATTPPTGSATGETAQTSQPPATAGQSSTTGTTGQTEPAGQTGSATGTTGQATTGEPGQPAESAQGDVNAEAAKQHLTAARDSLTQLTQLPAAAQLQGDARAQVSQLIQNFNELITTQENWRASYEKVDANLTALLGPDPEATEAAAAPATAPQPSTPDPSATTPPSNPPSSTDTPQSTQGTQGTPGAVGTSGTTAAGTTAATLDPGIKQKLVDFRNHLKAFHTAVGGDAK